MKKRYDGLDFLRGLGIFFVVILHSAFYYFGGLYELDLNDPPPMVTVIGLLLMFAGMFALISGIVHGLQFIKRSDAHTVTPGQIIRQFGVRGLIVYVIAMAYFIITGPGIVDMAAKSMDNSLLVEWISNGVFQSPSFQRIFYIDSLVMIASNIVLLGIFTALLYKLLHTTRHPWFSRSYFVGGLTFTALSLVRIPLYEIFMDAFDQGNLPLFFLLNWIVAKNNPILPYIAFGMFGMWIGTMLPSTSWKSLYRRVLILSGLFLATGVFLYIRLPDTMLQRGIDMKWFSIMLAQLGLFMMLILAVLFLFDFKHRPISLSNPVIRYISRFGLAGLSVFFLESVISAIVHRSLRIFIPGLFLTIPQAVLYGFLLALLWGFGLILWEKSGYRYGLEYFYGKLVSIRGKSSKLARLTNKED